MQIYYKYIYIINGKKVHGGSMCWKMCHEEISIFICFADLLGEVRQ